jgi:hypothetical protein
MPAKGPHPRPPRWFWIPVRVLVVTFLLTLLAFAVSLLLGIAGILVGSKFHRAAPNMAHAYRYIALPAAAAVAAIVLVSVTTLEIRHYHQAKALAEIERAG